MGRFKGRAFWERVVADVDGGMSQVEAARRHRVSQSGPGYGSWSSGVLRARGCTKRFAT
ncbi:Hypothetical protein A7982_00034 [Minicystis rosea]|nr:Hypothetical protein A7982_00034 [Minicystis rosea]